MGGVLASGRFKSQQLLTGPPILRAPYSQCPHKRKKKKERKGKETSHKQLGHRAPGGVAEDFFFFFCAFHFLKPPKFILVLPKWRLKKAFHARKMPLRGPPL